MKVVITGGAGYVGTELVNNLVGRPEISEIIVYDNLSRGQFNFFIGVEVAGYEKVRFVQGDILDSRKFRKVLAGAEAVYHLAARVSTPFDNVDSHFYEQVNHWGSAEVAYAAEIEGVKKVFYSGSMSVYGSGSSEKMLDEESVPNPRTFYGVSKMRGEEQILSLKDKAEVYIVRAGNVYGYSKCMRYDSVINRFMFDANYTGRINIHGNGKQWRSFIHIDALAKALADMLTGEVPAGVYNLTDKNLQVLDLVDAVKELYPKLEFIFVNQHLKLRNVKVSPESELFKYIELTKTESFTAELEEFRERFKFHASV